MVISVVHKYNQVDVRCAIYDVQHVRVRVCDAIKMASAHIVRHFFLSRRHKHVGFFFLTVHSSVQVQKLWFSFVFLRHFIFSSSSHTTLVRSFVCSIRFAFAVCVLGDCQPSVWVYMRTVKWMNRNSMVVAVRCIHINIMCFRLNYISQFNSITFSQYFFVHSFVLSFFLSLCRLLPSSPQFDFNFYDFPLFCNGPALRKEREKNRFHFKLFMCSGFWCVCGFLHPINVIKWNLFFFPFILIFLAGIIFAHKFSTKFSKPQLHHKLSSQKMFILENEKRM